MSTPPSALSEQKGLSNGGMALDTPPEDMKLRSGAPAVRRTSSESSSMEAEPVFATNDGTSQSDAEDSGGQIMIIRPRKADVLCGRGGIIKAHDGNRRYRLLIEDRRVKYSLSHNKDKKGEIIKEIVSVVHGQKPPGRFLEKHPSTTAKRMVWTVCDDERVYRKISQALREGAPQIREDHFGVRSMPGQAVRAELAENGMSFKDLSAMGNAKMKAFESAKPPPMFFSPMVFPFPPMPFTFPGSFPMVPPMMTKPSVAKASKKSKVKMTKSGPARDVPKKAAPIQEKPKPISLQDQFMLSESTLLIPYSYKSKGASPATFGKKPPSSTSKPSVSVMRTPNLSRAESLKLWQLTRGGNAIDLPYDCSSDQVPKEEGWVTLTPMEAALGSAGFFREKIDGSAGKSDPEKKSPGDDKH